MQGRVTPWGDWDEWAGVRDGLQSGSDSARQAAQMLDSLSTKRSACVLSQPRCSWPAPVCWRCDTSMTARLGSLSVASYCPAGSNAALRGACACGHACPCLSSAPSGLPCNESVAIKLILDH